MKQQSTTSRDDIKIQFDEIKNQFRSANFGHEPMLLICDSNVHVGGIEIDGCKDAQDWGGKELMAMVKEEGLILVNSLDLCEGVVTRVDPRNGTESTLDLAICNSLMLQKISRMVIDEDQNLPLKKYGTKVTQSDHNTVLLYLDIGYEKILKSTQIRYNTRNVSAREKMKQEISEDVVLDKLFREQAVDLNDDVKKLLERWDLAMKKSFSVVKCNRSTKRGIDDELKCLLDKEKWIRKNVLENPERGRRIAETQKLIAEKIADKTLSEVENKVNMIIRSDRPQSKVFKIRRDLKMTTNIDFPLKDEQGVLQVSREGIDKVIKGHFVKVFAQNPVPREEVWKKYWMSIDKLYHQIDRLTIGEYDASDEPKYEEIERIVGELKESKASYGPMSIDLVKLCDKKMVGVIYRCILMCFRRNVFPEVFQNERMTLLLKNKGIMDLINDYRGIFIRHVIVSVYQKWMYQRNAPVVDENGSEYACGGRKERAGMEALLILKLVQDYARWTKKEVIIKFLDIEKFFDSMNFRKSLIIAYQNGVRGRFWQTYKTMNERRKCIPHLPSGQCSSIEMNEIFVQGSCDAVLMAWPIMDAESKKINDPFSSDCSIEGIQINKISFVDDLAEFTVSADNTNERNIDNEIFEKKSRLNFKTSKCKVMPMDMKTVPDIVLDGEKLEVVDDHVYLGSIVSRNGQRLKDMQDRIKKTNSVANEIVQVCKETELSKIRLKYVKPLMSSCLDGKVKYGSALWNVRKSQKSADDLDKMKPSLLKRVLQLPSSTPSDSLLYEFGLNDLSIDILMEKIVLAVQILQLPDNRIAKQLLRPMLEKKVDGFCTELLDACKILNVSIDELVGVSDVRKVMKENVIKVQQQELYKRMSFCTKMDKVLLSGFLFNGKVMKYLTELDFEEARAVFMIRYRMMPSKANFPGRWSGSECNICGFEDTDAHVFHCPGYQDIICDKVTYNMFWDPLILNDIGKLQVAARNLLGIIERMEEVQKMTEK